MVERYEQGKGGIPYAYKEGGLRPGVAGGKVSWACSSKHRKSGMYSTRVLGLQGRSARRELTDASCTQARIAAAMAPTIPTRPADAMLENAPLPAPAVAVDDDEDEAWLAVPLAEPEVVPEAGFELPAVVAAPDVVPLAEVAPLAEVTGAVALVLAPLVAPEADDEAEPPFKQLLSGPGLIVTGAL
ncbi:hypothetical protein BD309DRAFT_948733 [Dichomitus squalens]|nr:hypothetical protein BD309DRAFT_948733 [Dichomitus squalens]